MCIESIDSRFVIGYIKYKLIDKGIIMTVYYYDTFTFRFLCGGHIYKQCSTLLHISKSV